MRLNYLITISDPTITSCDSNAITAIFRGLLNYLIMNAILSIGSITSLLMSNSLLLIISCYGKVGYYPFFSVLKPL